MALTLDQKQEQFAVLDRTGGHREVAKKTRVIPENYQAMLNQVEREEHTLSFEGMPPFRIVISRDPERKPGCPIHINFHGGGFIFPQDGDDDLYCAHVALGIRGIVVDVDYACSDKDPYPAAVNQAYAVSEWVFGQCAGWQADPNRVSAGGHSAGGNLVTVTAMKALQTGAFRFNLAVLDYAANDNYMAMEGGEESIRSKAFSLLYSNGDVQLLKDPSISPVYASVDQLKDFPTTLIVEAGKCPFVGTNRKFGAMLEEAGATVRFLHYPESRHGFTVRMSDDWMEAQLAIIDAIRNEPPVR